MYKCNIIPFVFFQVWTDQQRHIPCIQDPESFPLYMKTGTLKKGGVVLSCYRCARGSTSLESFHLHLNRFIPGGLKLFFIPIFIFIFFKLNKHYLFFSVYSTGTSASAAHFQAYLLEGLMRWNQDRMEQAVTGRSELRTYCSAEREAMARLSRKVLNTCLDEQYQPPAAYTGKT